MLEPPAVAGLAQDQLAAWQKLAVGWVSYPDRLGKVELQRCGSCHVGLYRTTDESGHPYHYSPDQLLAQVVAHLRQAHQDQDPTR